MDERRSVVAPSRVEPSRGEPELVALRKLARAKAQDRNETATTVHLLAAIAARECPASCLLAARKLDADSVLRAARSFDDDVDNPLATALAAARDAARRAAVPSREPGMPPPPNATHLLVVLLSNRRYAAYRALKQFGIDVAKLRNAATRVAHGAVAPPRRRREPAKPRPAVELRRRPTAVQVSLMPDLLPPKASPRPQSVTAAAKPRVPSDRATAVPDEAAVAVVAIDVAPVDVLAEPPALAGPLTQVPAELEFEALAADDDTASDEPSDDPAARECAPAEQVPETADEPPSPSARSSRTRERDALRLDDRTSRRRRRRDGEFPQLQLDAADFPTLSELGTNLSLAAARGDLEPIVGRELEVEQTLDVLAKRHANSALLVGPPGVGKTALSRALALRCGASATSSGGLRSAPKLLVELPVTRLLAGTSTRGSLAERLQEIRLEIRNADQGIVLFVDAIDELMAGGGDEGVAELRAGVAAGELTLIATTTPEAYRKHFDGDPGLARRFTRIDIEEPSEAESVLVLRAVARDLTRHHRVVYTDEGLAAAVSWSMRYLPGRALPDKAIALVDLAGARLKRRSSSRTVEPAHVAEVVAEIADVPLERLLESDGERMLRLGTMVSERIVGHAGEIERIAAVLRRNAAGLRGRRPIGTFLLLGPTGVGKTETAKAVAEVLFHNADAMTRLDMSEYAESHAVARLVGAPPGYVGHDAGGALTEALRRRPYQVLLLDEIEKAHRDVLESFLQVFDEGRLTDGRGKTVDFTNAVIMMTSNLGAEQMLALQNTRRVGFAVQGTPDRLELGDTATKAARAALPPELYNRIDEVVFFQPLSRADVREVARRMLLGLSSSLGERDIALDIDEPVIDALLDHGGYDAELGARPMRRAISKWIEAPLADLILSGDLMAGSAARVRVADDAIHVAAA